MNGYYKATDAKHIRQPGSPEGPGSVFTDPTLKNLNDVVALAAKQRGMSLEGDDREALVALGASWESFKPGVRYLKVDTPGTVGVKRSAGLPDDTPIHVVRSKPGASATPVLDVTEKPMTQVATVIIGKHPKDPSREVVFTAHPGMPTPSGNEDTLGHLEGQTVTLGEVRALFGHEVWLNTRVVTPQPDPRALAMASALHEQWAEARGRAERLKPDGKGGQIDIANTPYERLPPAFQKDNLDAAVHAVASADKHRHLPEQERVEVVASEVHDDWMRRNGSWAPPEQMLPYADLSEEEKEKDRVVARTGIAAADGK